MLVIFIPAYARTVFIYRETFLTFTVHSLSGFLHTCCGWNCTHDFYIVKLSWRTLWVKLHPWLLHCETFMVHTVGETSPTTFTSWNFHGVHPRGKFTPDFIIIKLSQCWLCGNIFKLFFHQHVWFLVNTWRKAILILLWKVVDVAQKLRELWSSLWIRG